MKNAYATSCHRGTPSLNQQPAALDLKSEAQGDEKPQGDESQTHEWLVGLEPEVT